MEMTELSKTELTKRSVWIVPYCKATGRVLIAKRSRHVSSNQGKWNFFGGGAEDGETAVESAKREFFEEAGVKLPKSAFEYIGKAKLRTKTKRYLMVYFLVDVPKEFAPRMNKENSQFKWVDFSGKPIKNPHHSIRGFFPLRHAVLGHSPVHAKLRTVPARMETRNVKR